jgi:MoaA/NifB/PqqE/SkfB family radical SAM enzyme
MKELTIEINRDCCLQCVHCSHNRKKEAEIDHPFFDEGEVIAMLDEFPQFDSIRFSGGEPFKDHRLVEYVREARARGKRISIVSSGVYGDKLGVEGIELLDIPQEILDELRGKVDLINFSIYGGEKTHDAVTRTPGSFNCLERSVNKVIRTGIPFSFVSVALKTSARGVEDAVKYVAIKKRISGTDPKLGYLRFIKQGAGAESLREALSGEELGEFRERSSLLGRKYDVQVDFGCSLREEGCSQGIGKAVVNALGEYANCSALKGGGKPEAFGCRERW